MRAEVRRHRRMPRGPARLSIERFPGPWPEGPSEAISAMPPTYLPYEEGARFGKGGARVLVRCRRTLREDLLHVHGEDAVAARRARVHRHRLVMVVMMMMVVLMIMTLLLMMIMMMVVMMMMMRTTTKTRTTMTTTTTPLTTTMMRG
mgnify:CR=1 FL=1